MITPEQAIYISLGFGLFVAIAGMLVVRWAEHFNEAQQHKRRTA